MKRIIRQFVNYRIVVYVENLWILVKRKYEKIKTKRKDCFEYFQNSESQRMNVIGKVLGLFVFYFQINKYISYDYCKQNCIRGKVII